MKMATSTYELTFFNEHIPSLVITFRSVVFFSSTNPSKLAYSHPRVGTIPLAFVDPEPLGKVLR